MHQRLEFHAMGSGMLAIVDGDGPAVAARLALVPAWFEVWEGRLSRFRSESELNRLNAAAGVPQPVSAVLWDVVERAIEGARATRGLVSPAIAPALEAAGYDRTFEALGTVAAPPVQAPSPIPDWRRVRLNRRARTICLPAGVRLDLGGIAKGWAADRAARRLRTAGPALVDASGDIAVNGPQADGQPWPIAVADPHQPDGQLDLIMLSYGAVATSGRDYHRWKQGDLWQHHIIDPRTSRPADTDVITATVVAPTAVEAEAAAKVALILGSRRGAEWLEARPGLAGLLVLEDGRVVRTARLRKQVWR
jgi:thiamine biosynthesis lipoprotein